MILQYCTVLTWLLFRKERDVTFDNIKVKLANLTRTDNFQVIKHASDEDENAFRNNVYRISKMNSPLIRQLKERKLLEIEESEEFEVFDELHAFRAHREIVNHKIHGYFDEINHKLNRD